MCGCGPAPLSLHALKCCEAVKEAVIDRFTYCGHIAVRAEAVNRQNCGDENTVRIYGVFRLVRKIAKSDC